MARVRQRDICRQILCNRILCAVFWNCPGNRDVLNPWRPKKFANSESDLGKWRILSDMQAETMDHGTQEIAN